MSARFLNEGQAVPPEAVRTEEMINYFRYDYPRPRSRDVPFSVTADVATTPWNADTRLMRIGLRGYDVDAAGRPPANLVFLVDVSGSMSSQDKLPLVKRALELLADRLTPKDKVSIVVYAGAAGVVLEPTANKAYVKAALSCLEAGGSTAGGAGIQLAYATARANFVHGGINRILLATDGDFNVGVNDNKALEEMVKRQREDGITLTTLGFGTGNYNEAMMERIADVGNGNYAYIDSAMEAQKVLDDELSATLFTIAGDVKIQVEFNPAQVKEYRLIGYENRALKEEDFDNDTVDAGDIGAGHQVTALYEIVPAGGAGWLPERRYDANRPAASGKGGELAYVKLRYKLPGQADSKLIAQAVPRAGSRPVPPHPGATWRSSLRLPPSASGCAATSI
ncbi:MAG: von Willebrand factor type A domain-containing protein [Sphingomonas sp.]